MGFIKGRHEYLFEQFKTSELTEVHTLISKYLTKYLGDIAEYSDDWKIIKEDGQELDGRLFRTIDRKGIRFNWMTNDNNSIIISIDLWKDLDISSEDPILNNPDYTIELNGNSVSSSLKTIVNYFKNSISELHDSESGPALSEDSEPYTIIGMDDEDLEEIEMDIFEIIKYRVYQTAGGYANSLIITGQSGVGKCHTKGTKIRMYNGDIKCVEDIIVGDILMGDDSGKRVVESTTMGEDILYKIIPTSKGFNSFGCNSDHILSLRRSNNLDEVVNVPVKEYINWSGYKKRLYKLYRKSVEYPDKVVELDPYFMGLWLGDGNSHNATIESMDTPIIDYIYGYANELDLNVSIFENHGSKSNGYKITNGKRGYSDGNFVINQLNKLNLLNNKHIPDEYLYNSTDVRKKLLSGLIDSDGYMYNKTYEISTKLINMANQIKYLCNSLGYDAWVKEKIINDKSYYLVRISGDLSDLPILLDRKMSDPRKQIKNVCHSGFELEEIGYGDYYGFTIDGNHLYCLDDYVITHNTFDVTKALDAVKSSDPELEYIFIKGGISSSGLYELLFKNNDKLIVFDDCDSVFGSTDSINLLKAALDSYPEREISKILKTHFDSSGMSMDEILANHYGDKSMCKCEINPDNKGKLPKTFVFTGQIIFISNLKGDEIDPTIVTRATAHIDVNLTHIEILDRMRKVMEKMRPDLKTELKEEVLELIDYLTTKYVTRHPLSIRALVNALNTRVANDMPVIINGRRVPMWQVLIKQDMLGKKVIRRQ